MGLLTTKLEEAELRNRMLKAELRNRQLKEELAKREGRKPPEVIVLRYDPFPDEDPLEGITPAPSAAAEVIRPEAASEAWAGPWEGQEAVAGEMQPVEPGAPEIAPKVPLGASRDFREDLSIPAEERDEDYLRQQGKRIKDMGILPGQAAEQEITGKTQEGWGARLERGWAKAKEHSLFFKTWGTISKLIGGVEHKRYRGRTLDPDVLRGYEYETRKAELEADRQREEEKRLGTAAGQLRSLEQAEAGELVPEAPSTRTGQIPPAPGEKILPEYREGPSLEPDVSDIGVQEKYREPIPREAEVKIQKALDEIESLPWKEIEKVGSHVVADLWDLSPYLVGITTATGSLSRLMQMKQFKYLRGMKALDNYAREYRALSSTNQARLEVEAMQMYGAGVRETIEQKSLEAAAKYAEYGRKIRITERVMKSLPVQTQEFVLAEAAKNNRVPTWEDYRKAAEMVIMFKAGGMVYDKVKGWVKSATRNKKALVLGREPGGVPIATESYSQLPKGLPEPITMKSRPGEPPGPVQGEPAGTASPGGLLPAPKVTPKRAPEAQGDLFEQPTEGKPQPRPKALREIYDPIGQLGEDLKKDPGNKYIQELIDAISDPVFKGILPTGYFRKSIDKLRKQKIPFSFGYLDINNLGGANAFFEEKAGHEGADDILRKVYGDIFMAQLRKEGGFAGKGRRADEISYALPYSTPEELRAFMGKVSQQVSNLPEIKALSGLTHGKSGLPNAGALNFDFGVTEGEGTIQEITIRADQEMSVNRALRKEKLAQEQGLIYDKNRKAYVRREQFEETGVESPDQPSGGPGTSVPKGREPRSEAAGQRVPERPASETPVEPQRGPTIPEEADLSQEDIDFIYDHLPPEKRPRPSGKIVEPLTPDEKLEAAQETYEKELEEYRRWEEWDTQFPHPYGKIARRMAQLVKRKGQRIPKGEKLQLSEHIPKKFFGIASDDLASIMREAGWSGESENDLMAILADYPDRALKPKPLGSVKEPIPGYSREQAQLDLAKKQEDMFAPQEEKAQRELKRIQAQRAQAAKARDKGTEGLPLFEGPAKGEAEQTSLFVKAPSKAEQLYLFKQLKKDVKEIKPVPETKLDPAIKKAREKAKPGWKAVFGDKGRISLKGLTLKGEGFKKFLETIQAFRNPMYETYRIIYSRDGVILDYDSFSSQLPGQSLVHPVDPYERIKHYYRIQDRMKRLGANEVRQLHNHPAQNVDPSKDDLVITEFFKRMFGKSYKGHIIINHRKGSILDPNGPLMPFDIADGSPDPYQPGKKIKNADEMMDVAASINNQKDHIGLSFFNSQLKVVGISSLHVNDFLKNPKQFIATVHNMARDRGATAIVASPPSPGSTELDIPDDLAKQLYDLKVKGEWLFFDTVYPDEMATSQMKYGARGRLGYDPETMKFLRVREETPSYDIDPQEPSKYVRKWRDVKAEFQSNRKRVPAKVLPIYDRWVRETQVRAFKLARLVNELKRMGTKAEREAVPFIIEGTDVPKEFNRPDLRKLIHNKESRARIDAMVNLVKPHYEEMQAYMAETLDTVPQEWIENYVTHIWLLKNKKQRDTVASWFTTSNQFLKKRTIETIAEGITERGLTPKTLDIAELISLHGQVVIQTTENKVFLDGINALEDDAGMKLIMPAHKAPKEWKIIDHPALLRYKYMGEGEKKIRVMGLNRTLKEYVEKIVTIERSGPSVAQSQSTPVKKLEEVITGALETRGMTPGESRTYLERLKATYAGKGSESAGGAESRKEEATRRFSQIVDEVEKKITVRYPKMEKRPVKYHPDLDPMMQAVFYRPWRPAGKLRVFIGAWEGANALLKQTQLSISFFHHIALGESAISIMGPMKTFMIALNLRKMWDALQHNKFDMFLDKWKVAEDAVRHGMILEANSDVQKAVVDKIIQGVGDYIETHLGKPVAASLRVIGWAKSKWDQALWDYYHNNLKLYSYEYIISKEMGRYIKQQSEKGMIADPRQVGKMKREIAAFINDTFGGQNLKHHMANPGFMRAFRAAMLSPDWLVSTLKQAIAIFGLAGVDPKLWSLRAKMGTAMWLKAAIYFGGASILINYLTTMLDDAEEKDVPFLEGKGKWMWENDPGHETHLFLGRGPEGEKIYIRHGKQFRELPEFLWDAQAGEWSPITASIKKFGGKAAPVPQIVSAIATGKSIGGFPIKELRDKEGWSKAAALTKYLATSWLPFSFSAFLDERKEFHFIQFGLPTSTGMTQFKTRKLMKTALLQKDLKFLKKVWTAAIENDIPDVELLFEQAVSELMADAQEEYKADLRKHGLSDKDLEKIQNRGQVKAATEVVQRMIRKKKSLERQENYEIMKKRIEMYLKRKQTMEEELSPKERDRFLDTLKSKRDKYELNLKL